MPSEGNYIFPHFYYKCPKKSYKKKKNPFRLNRTIDFRHESKPMNPLFWEIVLKSDAFWPAQEKNQISGVAADQPRFPT